MSSGGQLRWPAAVTYLVGDCDVAHHPRLLRWTRRGGRCCSCGAIPLRMSRPGSALVGQGGAIAILPEVAGAFQTSPTANAVPAGCPGVFVLLQVSLPDQARLGLESPSGPMSSAAQARSRSALARALREHASATTRRKKADKLSSWLFTMERSGPRGVVRVTGQ